MNPEEALKLKNRVADLENTLSFILSDKFDMSKDIKMQDGRNFQFAKGTGTKIGTETEQKLAFYNAAPVNQPDTISDPSGGGTIDTEARTAVNALIDRLQELGLIA